MAEEIEVTGEEIEESQAEMPPIDEKIEKFHHRLLPCHIHFPEER